MTKKQMMDRIEELEEALRFYVDMTRLEPPDDWDYMGMGGGPEFSDYTEVDIGQVARDALVPAVS